MATPSLEAFVNDLIEQKLRQMQTAYPAEVIDYDSSTSVATVKPLFIEAWRGPNDERLSETIEEDEDAYVENVLVMHPRTAAFRIALPLDVGDTGLVVCTKFSLDRFRGGGGMSDPGDLRKFGTSGSVFFPVNLYVDSDPLDASDDDAFVTISQGGTAQFVSLANLVDARIATIQDAHDTHVHDYEVDSGITDAPNSLIGALADTESATLKAD